MKFVKNLPPKAGGGRKPGIGNGAYQAEAERLRARPGQWALLKSFDKHGTASVLANEVKRGKYVAFRPAGSFEGATRKQGGRVNVYVRFVGK